MRATTIRVSHGLCSAIRPKVLTALETYGVRVIDSKAWGLGHWHIQGVSDDTVMPDDDIWVRYHVMDVTVNDKQAAWAERLLWQTNQVMLNSRPLNKGLRWTAPPACKVGVHGVLGRGDMPTPWSAQKRPLRAAKQKKAAKPRRKTVSILDFFRRF